MMNAVRIGSSIAWQCFNHNITRFLNEISNLYDDKIEMYMIGDYFIKLIEGYNESASIIR